MIYNNSQSQTSRSLQLPKIAIIKETAPSISANRQNSSFKFKKIFITSLLMLIRCTSAQLAKCGKKEDNVKK